VAGRHLLRRHRDPHGSPDRGWWTGPGAITETGAFVDAGKDVHVFIDGHLVPWAEIHAEMTDEPVREAHPRAGLRARLEVISP
jgi:hypothetical protein